MISTTSKMNMRLDEIQYVESLEQKVKDLEVLMSSYDELTNKYDNLNKSYTKLYNKFMENMEVVELEDWIIHKTFNNNEYVSGYKMYSEYKNDNIWETSNILSKTATKYGIFVITKTEHIYYLPYKQSYY